MKTGPVVLLIIITILCSCGVSKQSVTEKQDEGPESANTEQGDSIEYQLIIFDPAFDIWLNMNAPPESHYTQEYLEYWNNSLALQWNSFSAGTGRMDCRPTTHLDYDSSIDYGKEINYRLYNYFRFVNEGCQIFNNRPGDWRR